MQCVPGFVLDPQTRRSTPPNQVRYPTDRQFVSGCSPPCLTATQLPSTTRSWLVSTRTSTALMRCPLGRTDPGLRRDANSLSLAGFNARLFAILRANRCAAIVPGQSWVCPRLANKTQLTTRPETREH